MKRLTAALLTLALLLTLIPSAFAGSPQSANPDGVIRHPDSSSASSPAGEDSLRRFASLADGNVDRAQGNFVSWIDRVDLPPEADAFYAQLKEGADGDGVKDWLIDDSFYSLSGTVSDPKEMSMGDFGLFRQEGATFAGILVTTLTLNRPWTTQEETYLNAVIRTAYSAFDRDCPEVFWLTGESNICYILQRQGSSYTYYMFFPVRYESSQTSFDLRDPDYPDEASIRHTIALREQSIETILATVPSGDRYRQLEALNTWLVEHNEYNTAVNSGMWYGRGVGSTPWECISALAGRSGRDGPVCEGYARAFMVLCSRLNIPCVLVDGKASYLGGARIGHMWNYVQMEDGRWYAADLTWNDPSGGSSGALSGRERDLYLLVGANTVLQDTAFASCHFPENLVTYGGVAFLNGPVLNPTAYSEEDLVASFLDVHASDWYAEAVAYASQRGIMNGTGENLFSPAAITTRGTIAMLLYNLEDRPPVGVPVFLDTPSSAWYTDAVTWAADLDLVNGFGDGTFGPDTPVTREQMAQILFQYARQKGLSLGGSASLFSFPDGAAVSPWARSAVEWAVGQGLLTGTGEGLLNPGGTADRAQVAALLMRFCQRAGL